MISKLIPVDWKKYKNKSNGTEFSIKHNTKA